MEQRLQKLLSSCGIGSRRTMEQWIADGRVSVNGRVARIGDRADPDCDEICVDDVPVCIQQDKVYLMLNKPRGYVTTLSDEQGRRNVAQLTAGCGRRVWPVGRLDLDSEGLLIMTDDGALTQTLIHPSYEIEKEYLVWVTGDADAAIPILRAPMKMDGVMLSPAKIKRGKTSGEITQLSIVIHQGKNRQVRRMCAAAGLSVRRLKRIREGKLLLDRSLLPGQWRYLTESEVSVLRQHT